MKRRYRIMPPPADAEYLVGEMIEFTPEDDAVNAGRPPAPTVELTPVGPPAVVIEFTPEDDLLTRRALSATQNARIRQDRSREDRSLDAATGAAIALNNLGSVRRHQGQYSEALAVFDQAVSIQRRIAQSRPGTAELMSLAFTLNSRGEILRELGALAEAAACFEEAWSVYRQFV